MITGDKQWDKKDLLATYPACRAVITCRTAVYKEQFVDSADRHLIGGGVNILLFYQPITLVYRFWNWPGVVIFRVVYIGAVSFITWHASRKDRISRNPLYGLLKTEGTHLNKDGKYIIIRSPLLPDSIFGYSFI